MAHMRRHLLALAASLLAILPACQSKAPAPPPAPARSLTYDGATAISQKILPLSLPVFEQRAGVKVKVEQSGSGKGLKAVLAGRVDVAGVARALSPEERSQKPWVAIIGYDAVGVWVNERNPLRGLTRAQLRDLFTGKITSWKQLGGEDRPVVACTEPLDSEGATLATFQQLALDGAAFGPVKTRAHPSDCLALVASEPGAVTPASIAFTFAGTRMVSIDGVAPEAKAIRTGDYFLTRPLLLVTREPPAGALRDFVEFMVSPEGQALVAQAGFVAAR